LCQTTQLWLEVLAGKGLSQMGQKLKARPKIVVKIVWSFLFS